MTAQPQKFGDYLTRAIDRALKDEVEGNDKDNLKWVSKLARRGVHQNWADLAPRRFLKQLLWCVGSIQKKYWVHEQYFPAQCALFRQCNPADIVRNAGQIRAEWAVKKCDLNSKMLESVIATATKVEGGWDAFKAEYLPLPENPESESMNDWWDSYSALDRLPMVGDAIAWYLIRNLYGAPFFKPDLHINAIAKHFFGSGKLVEMSSAVRKLWPQACTDPGMVRTKVTPWGRFATCLPRQ